MDYPGINSGKFLDFLLDTHTFDVYNELCNGSFEPL